MTITRITHTTGTERSSRTRAARLAALVGACALTLTACGSVDNAPTPEEASEKASETVKDADEWKAPEGLTGTIDYYSANPQGLTDALVEAFEAKTDVTVNTYADTTGKITARLKAEEANPQADVVYLASWSAARAQEKAGNLKEYTPEGSDDVHDGWVDDEEKFTGRDGSALALVYNTDVITDAPKDWKDLTDEKYKDQIIMPDPRESGTAADLIAAMVEKWGEDDTWDLFEKLFDNGMVVRGANGPALDEVKSGSRGIVFGGVDYSAYSAKGKGEAIDVVIPASGTTVTPRPVMILDSTDNEEAAEAFVDFMFSEEAQAISASKNMIPANKDVELVNGAKLDDIEQLSDDWDEISEESKDVTEKFVEKFLN